MVKNDYHVIVCKILKYLYACLKNGEDVDSDKLMDIIGDLPESYADYITPKEIEYLNDNRYLLKVREYLDSHLLQQAAYGRFSNADFLTKEQVFRAIRSQLRTPSCRFFRRI